MAEKFKATGIYHNGAESIEIQINNGGDAARYRSTIRMVVRDHIVKQGRWQEIRYTQDGSAYITKDGKRLHLHKFLRIY